jgi:hypothetical protein
MKPPPDPLLAISASTIAGIALWLSRASFDMAGTTAAPIRVAMLPSLAELMGFVTLALLVAAGMASLVRKDGSFWEPATDALRPLFTLSLLILPYLPWLADWVPALRLLAGPGRILIWVVVLGQVLWVFLPQLTRKAGIRSPIVSRSAGATLFGILSVALSAPFVLNVRAIPAMFIDAFNTIRALPSAAASSIPAGTLGVLFDQEYGIVAYAPVLLLGFIGLFGMARQKSHRWLGLALTAATVGLILLPATVDPWWSRSMLPGRPVFLLLPLLAVPIAWLYARLEPGSRARAGAQALLLVTVAITLTLTAFDSAVPALQEGDGTSSLLQWMSPTWQVWREVPTYVEGITPAATLRLLLWVSAFGTAAWLLARLPPVSDGRASLAGGLAAVILFLGGSTVAAVALAESGTGFDVEGRVLFPLLETFDPVARPIGLRYDPFARVEADALPPLFALSAVPEQRVSRQPVRVVLNARFRLPAGQYVLDLKGSDAAGSVPNASIALQIGREGRPIETWPLVLGRGERIHRDFDVPLDAEFVGFRAPRSVERAIAELRIRPRSVVEKRRRLPAGTVLSAAHFGAARIFFHDSFSYSEPEGFWVKGRATARMTLLKTRERDAEILLAVHSGARPNVVTFTTPRWSQKLELVPGVTERVVVPSSDGERFIPLTITNSGGFVPADIEHSRDRRLLGAWVEFIPDDTAKTSAVP